MAEMISWVATIATVVAAFMTASNLGSRVTGLGFAVFTIGALCWIRVGVVTHQPALLWTNVILAGLDLFGVWRWLGRQAGVEEGARAASHASEVMPGETLFAASLLTHAPLISGRKQLGTCIDAMAGCESGRISYVVVSEGGVAGIGETLRRLPWDCARVDGERVMTGLDEARFERLQELERDEWPAR